MSKFLSLRSRKSVIAALAWVLAAVWSGLFGGLGVSAAQAAPQAQAAATSYSALPTDYVPNFQNEHASLELGIRAKSSVTGWITTARFYKGASDTSSHTAQVWSSNGTLLATKAFTNETASGWQSLTFDTPIQMAADTEFTVSIFSTDFWYGASPFPEMTRGPITIINGYYNYTGASAFPAETVGTNYAVDFGFEEQDYRPAGPANEPGAMKFTIETVGPNENFTAPLRGTVDNITIDWGDGSSTGPVNAAGNYSHNYPNPGTFHITVDGTELSGWGDRYVTFSNLISIDNFGTLGTTSFNGGFPYATKLEAVPSTLPPGVTDLAQMFAGYTSLNQDISGWDTSQVTDMNNMFWGAQKFNAPVNDWDVSKVTNMSAMFSSTLKFNKPLNNWDTSSVMDMNAMFTWSSEFNQPLSNWNTSKVTNFGEMFAENPVFNQDISNWDTHSATNMKRMMSRVFNNGSATDDQAHPMRTNGNKWNVSNVTDFTGLFAGHPFNQDISNWDVSSGIYFDEMFNNASNFDQNLSTWNTSSAVSMTYMFTNSAFTNQGHAMTANASKWNVSKVTDFTMMFAGAKIDQDFSSWNFASATNLNGMFRNNPLFDNGGQPLTMNTSKVVNMTYLFTGDEKLNQPLNIDTRALIYAQGMFINCTKFNQDVSGWDVSKLQFAGDMFNNATLFNNGGQALDWNTSSLQYANYMFYGATNFDADISSWNTSNLVSTEAMFALATNFSKNISAWDVRKLVNSVWMFYLNEKFNQSLNNWDTASLQYTSNMFRASNFNGAIGDWDTSNLVTTSGMFMGNKEFNQSLENWDVSNVSDFEGMFEGATAFNKPLSTWDMSGARTVAAMFRNSGFNSSVAGWNLDKATNLAALFAGSPFNQPLTGWKTPSMNSAVAMFAGASAFNQDLSGLDIHNLTDALWILDSSGLSAANYSKLLNAWAAAPHKNNVRFSASGVKYTLGGKEARDLLKTSVESGGSNWDIYDGGLFVMQTPTITTAPTAAGITFGAKLSEATLSGGEASVPGTFAYKTPDVVPGAGAVTRLVIFTPTDTANYESVELAVMVVVSKADRSLVSKLLGVLPWLFGNTFDSSVEASAGTGSITYSATGGNCTANASSGILTALKAGLCEFSAEIAENDDYKGASLSGSATIQAVAASQPMSVFGKLVEGKLDISWAAPTSDGGTPITGYKATVTDGTNSYNCETDALTLGCIIGPVELGGEYKITVVAYSNAGASTSADSMAATVDTADDPATDPDDTTDDGTTTTDDGDTPVDSGSGDGTGVDDPDSTDGGSDGGTTDSGSEGGKGVDIGTNSGLDAGTLTGIVIFVIGGLLVGGFLIVRRRKG